MKLFFLGMAAGIALLLLLQFIFRRSTKYDGAILIDTHNAAKDVYLLSLDDDLATLSSKKQVIFRVNPNANLSQEKHSI